MEAGQSLQLAIVGPFEYTTTCNKYWMKVICEVTNFCWDFFIVTSDELLTNLAFVLNTLEMNHTPTCYISCNLSNMPQSLLDLCLENGITIRIINNEIGRDNVIVKERFFHDGLKVLKKLHSIDTCVTKKNLLREHFAIAETTITNITTDEATGLSPHMELFGFQSKIENHINLGKIGHIMHEVEDFTWSPIKVVVCGFDDLSWRKSKVFCFKTNEIITLIKVDIWSEKTDFFDHKAFNEDYSQFKTMVPEYYDIPF